MLSMRLTMFITVRTHVSSAREWECGYRCPCPCVVVAEEGEMGLDMDMEGVEVEAARKMCVALGKKGGLGGEDGRRRDDSPEACGELDVDGSGL
jgi:hypothetical protein